MHLNLNKISLEKPLLTSIVAAVGLLVGIGLLTAMGGFLYKLVLWSV